MNRKDAEAVPWMATKTRETWPKKVVWGHSNTRSDRFYWLGGIQKGVIEGEVKGQTITVKGVADQKLTFWLNDQLLDLDQPVKIVIDEKEVFNGKINRSQKAIEESLAARLDFAMVATAMWQQEAAQ